MKHNYNMQNRKDSFTQYKMRFEFEKISRVMAFLSSKQNLQERDLFKSLAREYRDTYKFPIYAVTVEDDQNCTDMRDLWNYIKKRISDCDFFFGILIDDHRDMVEKEIRHAFTLFNSSKITLYVKNSPETLTQWNQLLVWIRKQNSVKYFPFTDAIELKSLINQKFSILARNTKSNIIC